MCPGLRREADSRTPVLLGANEHTVARDVHRSSDERDSGALLAIWHHTIRPPTAAVRLLRIVVVVLLRACRQHTAPCRPPQLLRDAAVFECRENVIVFIFDVVECAGRAVVFPECGFASLSTAAAAARDPNELPAAHPVARPDRLSARPAFDR